MRELRSIDMRAVLCCCCVLLLIYICKFAASEDANWPVKPSACSHPPAVPTLLILRAHIAGAHDEVDTAAAAAAAAVAAAAEEAEQERRRLQLQRAAEHTHPVALIRSEWHIVHLRAPTSTPTNSIVPIQITDQTSSPQLESYHHHNNDNAHETAKRPQQQQQNDNTLAGSKHSQTRTQTLSSQFRFGQRNLRQHHHHHHHAMSNAMHAQLTTDIDECLDERACGRGATCENLPGSFRCACPPGFTGDPSVECIGKHASLATPERDNARKMIASKFSEPCVGERARTRAPQENKATLSRDVERARRGKGSIQFLSCFVDLARKRQADHDVAFELVLCDVM